MRHQDQVLNLLRTQITTPGEVNEIHETAEQVAAKWANPLSGGTEETNGLIYGLIQSGKTGVLTVTGAIGADEGYRTLLILTSDNDPLYEQTLGRCRAAFPGIDIIGKSDFRNRESFLQRVKSNTCAIVSTKNSAHLKTLIDNFQHGNVRGLSCLIIDDEADQASLNTKERRNDGSRSTINERIQDLRSFFLKNTYLQVTATPQALFLQSRTNAFRPKFTVLSHPGADYVGGDDFFGDDSQLVRNFPIADLTLLAPGAQPSPQLQIPRSLRLALDTFMIGATFKRSREADQNCAFLCHVSTRKSDHNHIVDIMRSYKEKLAIDLKEQRESVIKRLKTAYDDLATTHPDILTSDFGELLRAVEFFSPGINVKLVNGETDEDVAVQSPYNLFVGGNKLGRGVTIKNLLVSYYGRNPRTPQADTVLQHARMYGYRRKDIGLLRLFLPHQLHVVFRAIHKMERSLRSLIEERPDEEFRGIYVESGVSPTRKNVLAPGAIGAYSGGSTYNPAQVLRTPEANRNARKIDEMVKDIRDKTYSAVSVDVLRDIIHLVIPDEDAAERVWDSIAIADSVMQFAKLRDEPNAYIYVDRDRGLKENRRETQGILDSGEAGAVPVDKLTLFLLRTKKFGNRLEVWWPQLRFPTGRYAFAFAI